jgi:hypothetical protein
MVPQLPSLAQSKQLSPIPSEVKITYDKKNNETTESVPLVIVKEVPGTIEARFPDGTRNLPSETLRMTAYFSYPGRTFVKPTHVMLAFLSLVQGEAKYRETDEVTVRVDGQSLNIGKLRVADQRVDTNMELKDVNYWRETLELSMETPEFLRIANGRKVTVKLGNTELDLSAEQIKLLRVLASRVGA